MTSLIRLLSESAKRQVKARQDRSRCLKAGLSRSQSARPARPSFWQSVGSALGLAPIDDESESDAPAHSLSEDETTALATAAVYAEGKPAAEAVETETPKPTRLSAPEPMRRGRVLTIFSDTRAQERHQGQPLVYRMLTHSVVKIMLAFFTLSMIGLIGGSVLRAIEMPIMAEKRAAYLVLWDSLNASGNATGAQLMALTKFGLPPRDTAFLYWDSLPESWQFVLSTCATIGYGGVRIEDNGAKIFVIFLVLLSIPIFVRALQIVGHEVLKPTNRLVMYFFVKDPIEVMFNEWDEDRDGRISPDELQIGVGLLLRQGVLRDTDEERALAWIQSVAQSSDENTDGELSLEEFRHCIQKMDINGYEFVQRSYRNRVLGVMMLLYISLGVSLFCGLSRLSFVDSLYFVVISLTTIGLGDFTIPRASEVICIAH